MATLTPTLFPCYAPADRSIAERIAAFLERGAEVRVFLDEGEMQPEQTLAQKVREARMADSILVLFSRDSLPPRWARLEWEDPLVTEPAAENIRIAFAKCAECNPPRILAPMFDLTANSLKAMREIKRWFRGHEQQTLPSPATDREILGISIADRPGCDKVTDAEQAAAFAESFRADFDQVFTVDCSGRTLAAQAGDLAAQLGLRLEGTLDTNLPRLAEFCRARRFLIILESGADGEMVFGGRTSTLISGTSSNSPPDPIRDAQQLFARITQSVDWTAACRSVRNARRLLRDQFRFAECQELMTAWRQEAARRADAKILDEATRELIWILETWGQTGAARELELRRVAQSDEQLPLPFA